MNTTHQLSNVMRYILQHYYIIQQNQASWKVGDLERASEKLPRKSCMSKANGDPTHQLGPSFIGFTMH